MGSAGLQLSGSAGLGSTKSELVLVLAMLLCCRNRNEVRLCLIVALTSKAMLDDQTGPGKLKAMYTLDQPLDTTTSARFSFVPERKTDPNSLPGTFSST